MSLLLILAAGFAFSEAKPAASIVTREFLFEAAPFAQCHASTIVETPSGLVAAWFGGTREGDPSVGIWLSRRLGDHWTPPTEVADGNQPDGSRLPCWNPVLTRQPHGPLLLFYKVGPNPREWWGMLKTSLDHGQTWTDASRLPDGILGPIKNKPLWVDGTLVCPSSTESTTKPEQWRLRFELTNDLKTWQTAVPSDDGGIDAIQPSLLNHGDGTLQAVGRTRAGKLFQTWSRDRGRSWEPVTLTMLPNPNSGTDALTLRDGRHVLIYNHTAKGRSPLNVALSSDGKAWQAVAVLESEPGEYSYPACIQTADDRVHVTYTWKRVKIRHIVLNPSTWKPVPITNGQWPEAVP